MFNTDHTEIRRVIDNLAPLVKKVDSTSYEIRLQQLGPYVRSREYLRETVVEAKDEGKRNEMFNG